MSTATDIVVTVTLFIAALIINRVSIIIFHPSGMIYGLTQGLTHLPSAATQADFMYRFLVLYLPLLLVGVGILWPILNGYRRQATSAQIRHPRP